MLLLHNLGRGEHLTALVRLLYQIRHILALRVYNKILFHFYVIFTVPTAYILVTVTATDLMLDSKLRFHCHLHFLHSQALRISEFFRYITYNFSSL
jgi:hypothetical protein